MRSPQALLFTLPCVLTCSAEAIDPVPSSDSAFASVKQGLLTDSGELPPCIGLKSSDLSGNVAVVGAPGTLNLGLTDTGASYGFKRSGTAWNWAAKLSGTLARPGGRYGHAVAISGDGAILAVVSIIEKEKIE